MEIIQDTPTPPQAADASANGDATTSTPGVLGAASPQARSTDKRDQYSVYAWVRERMDLTLGKAPADPSYLAVPYDRALSRSQAFVRFRYARGRWFELNASSDVTYAYFSGGRSSAIGRDAHAYPARGSFEPNVRELYFGFFTPAIDIRIGQQRVAWGRADSESPNDVLNARDFRDPFSSEIELNQIPTPLARVDWTHGSTTLEGIWAPVFVPDRFDIYGSNWAIVQPNAPAPLRGFFRTLGSLVDSSLQSQFNRLVQQTQLPEPGVKNMSGGAKLATTVGGVDLDFYYYYGFSRTPYLKLEPSFAKALAVADFAQAAPSDFGPFFNAIAAGQSPLTLEYERNHHTGFDAATTVGPTGLRFDAGYDSNQVVFRRDLTGLRSRALQATASFEYQTGDVRKVLLVEASVLHLFDATSADALLFVNSTTVSGVALARLPIANHFDAELRAIAMLEPWSVAIRPQLGFRPSDHFLLAVGGLWLTGDPAGRGGYFSRNSDVHTTVKYTF